MSWKYACTTCGRNGPSAPRASIPIECVVGQLEQAPAGAELEPGRLLELEVLGILGQVRRPERRRRAVRVAEVGDGRGDVFVEVPAATTEEAGVEPDRAQPGALLADERGGVASRGSCMIGSRPVRVQAERCQRLSLARTFEPELFVLSVCRGSHQRRDREPGRPTALQPRETQPDLVVERAFHMTRDDGVPSVHS